MLWTIAVVLFVLWALGMVSSIAIGGFIHILLVLAIIVVLINVIQGRRGTGLGCPFSPAGPARGLGSSWPDAPPAIPRPGCWCQ